MTGAAALGARSVRLRISVTMTGLAPGESVKLQAAVRYRVFWTCGIEPCEGEGLCPFAYSEDSTGTVKATVHAVARSDGTASARLRLVVPPRTTTCPADQPTEWWIGGERWTRITVTDPMRRLRLTPKAIESFDTY